MYYDYYEPVIANIIMRHSFNHRLVLNPRLHLQPQKDQSNNNNCRHAILLLLLTHE